MDKIKRSTNTYLSRVYESPKHPASFSGLDKLYRIAKKNSLASHVMKSSNGQRLTCHIHCTNHPGEILSVIRYMLQKSIAYGKLI